MRRGLSYHNRRSSGGYNPFSQLGPTLDLTFAGNVTNLLDPNGFTLDTNFIAPQYLIGAQYTIWEAGVGLVSKTFSDIITFTRTGTNATYFNSAGVLTSAGADVPRFDYNPATLAAQGLLIEEQRTNLTLQSEDFATTWAVTGATVSTNATTAPSGTTTADKLQEDTSTGSHLVTQNITFTAAAHTASVFAKKAERDFVRVLFFDGTNTFSAFFNLSNGTVGTLTGTGTTATITAVGNGWYRCTVTATTAAGSGSFAPRIALADGNSLYTGVTGNGIFLWGAQLEAGAFPTSYIPTTTTALTRSADVASVNTLSPWFNASAGTLYAEYAVSGSASASAFPSTAALSDGTGNNRINLASTNTGASLYSYGEVQAGGAPQAGFYGASGSPFGVGTSRKVAIAYAANDFAFTTQGLAVQTDTSGTVPTVDRLYLGVSAGGIAQFQNGYLRRIAYYPRRLSNAELQAITT